MPTTLNFAHTHEYRPVTNINELAIGDEVSVFEKNGPQLASWEKGRHIINYLSGDSLKISHTWRDGPAPNTNTFTLNSLNSYHSLHVWRPVAPKSIDTKQKPAKTKPMTPFSSIISRDGTINALVRGKAYSLASDSQFYEAAKAALRAKDADMFVHQCNLELAVRERSYGKAEYKDGVVLWNGVPVNNALTKRITELVRQNFDFEPLLKFLENAQKNPSPRAVDELYLFLEANVLPITEDGCFLAYRRVGKDYMSIHENPDGTRNRNKPGDVVTKHRGDCNPNRDETCSRGLHFCSMGYLPSYSGARTVIVKISPEDIVSIPSDYNNQKGRCCKYEVVDEHLPNDDKDVLSAAAVYETTPTGVKPSGQKFHNRRDPATGRFVKK